MKRRGGRESGADSMGHPESSGEQRASMSPAAANPAARDPDYLIAGWTKGNHEVCVVRIRALESDLLASEKHRDEFQRVAQRLEAERQSYFVATEESNKYIRKLEAELAGWERRLLESRMLESERIAKETVLPLVARAENAESEIQRLESLIQAASESLYKWNENQGSGHAVEAYHMLIDEVSKWENIK